MSGLTTTDTLYELTINLPPRTKKNSQVIAKRNGRTFLVQSKLYREYERDCLKVIKPPEKPIDEPVNVMMHFYMPTKRRVDLVNLENACLDILVRAGVLADDNHNIVESMDGSRVFHSKDESRTEVTITRG